ncbi:MAG: PadR family transcriptional regulator [Alphaproteobacteria bacterium]|nr:PadR family transcriptional regulator [Alphaproteobacteria bacterium]
MSLQHAILGFLDLEPSTGYTLDQRFAGSVGSFWTATRSQIYRELHAAERAGRVRVEVVPQDGRPARKVYHLTEAGRAALADWLAEPVGPAQLRDPFLLKLVFSASAPPEVTDGLLAHLQAELEASRAEYAARLERPEIFTLARSEREALLWRLSIENGLAWCEAQLAWAARARAALAEEPPEGGCA